MTHSFTALVSELSLAYPAAATLRLDMGDVTLSVRSSSLALLDLLRRYFGELVTELTTGPELHVTAIDAPPPLLPFSFRPWPRETGARQPKESFADLEDGRIVRKLSSGLCFVLTPREVIAIGPCLANPNQLINFILSQYTSQKLHQGWSLCHAAAVAHEGHGLAIAGNAGRGKSTLALHLVSQGLCFVSNDRLLIRGSRAGADALGLPKRPRVNPGTLLHNPDLAGILPSPRRTELSRLPPRALWNLEEKHDVVVERIYGSGRTRRASTLSAVLVLDWQVDAELPPSFHAVRLSERRDLLGLLLKSPGVFHRDVHGHPAALGERPDPDAYLRALSGVPVLEATGRVDFALAADYCKRLLESRGASAHAAPTGSSGASGGGGTEAGSMG